MKTVFAGVLSAVMLSIGSHAHAAAHAPDCGEVQITEMNWASAAVITAVATFLMDQGYGCKVTKVPSDTVPAATSLAETGKPDIVTEMWYNSAPVYAELEAEGKVVTVAEVLSDGGEEGWWIPAYLAEQDPGLAKIDNILKNPAAVGGKFHNCPSGWGCRVANDNYKVAYAFARHGLEVFDHGSGETLATSIAEAYADQKPWFGYYWAPTAVLGKFPMVKVDVGPYDADAHTCAQKTECANPRRSAFPSARVVTGVTKEFAEENPQITELMSRISFTNAMMGALLAWQETNSASADEVAVYFLSNHSDIWSQWISDSAKQKLSALIK